MDPKAAGAICIRQFCPALQPKREVNRDRAPIKLENFSSFYRHGPQKVLPCEGLDFCSIVFADQGKARVPDELRE